VRARALSAAPAAGPPSGCQLARAWAALVAAVLAVAALVALVAPGWLGEGERALANDPLLALDIFTNNLLLCLVPLLGGWLAAGQLRAGRRGTAGLLAALAGAPVIRSLATIGAVGGADPGWLLAAAPWWALELAALAAASRTGLWLARHPGLRDEHGPTAFRRALYLIVSTLAVGALVEVLAA
jgi:hypothetical protein